VELPRKVVERPIRQVGKRLTLAFLVLVVTARVVWADRDGYLDDAGGSLSLLDCFYYATVTLSATGYGDITVPTD
jgi:voltage-gated potassium channel